jgi:hypothetical protein
VISLAASVPRRTASNVSRTFWCDSSAQVGLYAEPFSVKHKFADGAGWTYNPTKKQRAKGLKVGAKANDGARLATCDAYPTEKGSCPSI